MQGAGPGSTVGPSRAPEALLSWQPSSCSPWAHRSPALLSTAHWGWALGHLHSSLNGHCQRLHVPFQPDSCSQEPALSEEEAARSSGSCSAAWAVTHAALCCGQVKQAFAFCILTGTRNHAGAFLEETQANPGSESQDGAVGLCLAGADWLRAVTSPQRIFPLWLESKLPSPLGWWVRAGLLSTAT